MIENHQRVCIEIRGTVQGVGFRPFVFRLATQLGLTGWVHNSVQGVHIEVEGNQEKLWQFQDLLLRDKPEHCVIQSLVVSLLKPMGDGDFQVKESMETGRKTAAILPDLATCADCIREIFDPANHRFRYPFTNCTHCGPRFSIVEGLPYDRARTTMKCFAMCDLCREEYDDPGNRRFHAQPNACPQCGPHLELWDADGKCLAARDEGLMLAVEALRNQAIVAVKGLGGFHLLVDARHQEAVLRLRLRKAREEKPFALMFPDLETIRYYCELTEEEEKLLRAPAAPIVLLRALNTCLDIAAAVAPGNPYLGVMLPYTPLHHLLMADLGFPIVATSGNRCDEPICTDEREALRRLHGIADLFLVHDRPIARAMEDSVACVALGRPMRLRCGRGYAPLTIPFTQAELPILATGTHLKNTVALGFEGQVVISQHLGDLETMPAHEAFTKALDDLPRLYEQRPVAVACDLHPDYLSTRAAEQMQLPMVRIQHHEAHVWSCLADNELSPPALGVAWDGTGYGPDGTVWGGEFLQLTVRGCRRIAYFRSFRLPGGDTAIREPRRSALGMLYEIFGHVESDCLGFSLEERNILAAMLQKGINSPQTSSVGRIFDAVAAILGLRSVSRFEGQAAMDLQFAATDEPTNDSYLFPINPEGVIDWEPMIRQLLKERKKISLAKLAAKFHNTLAEIVVAVARRVGEPRVLLTGGCFQNRLLLEKTVLRLRATGFTPYWHRRVPPNDGGISLGQIVGQAFPPDADQTGGHHVSGGSR